MTAVYRLYDDRNVLLYVGISDNPERRWQDHGTKPWWPTVTRRTVAWFDTRVEALAEETRAILRENPLHNVAGTPQHTAVAEPRAFDRALMGAAEIQQAHGWSRQRVQQVARRSDFPPPAATLAMGKVWHAADVRRWAEERGRLTDTDR